MSLKIISLSLVLFLSTALSADFIKANLTNEYLLKLLWSKPERLGSGIADNGAISVNAEWEKGNAKEWFVEQQRYGGDYLMCAAATGDEKALTTGKKVLDWAFARQDAKGGFAGTGDPFHSCTMFFEPATRGILCLKTADANKYKVVIDGYLPKLELLKEWICRDENRKVAEKYSVQYTHRRWILAAGLMEYYRLTGDQEAKKVSLEYATLGLAMQQESGVNPEKGGYDVNYQTFGLMLMCRFLSASDDATMNDKVKGAVGKGYEWLKTRVSETGEIDATGSTRVGGDKTEVSRSGTPKKIGMKELIQSFMLASMVLGVSDYEKIAKTIATKTYPTN